MIELTSELQVRIVPICTRRNARWQLDIRLYRRQTAAGEGIYLPTLAGFRMATGLAAQFAGKVLAVAKACES
ncbi:MAG: hypothetical protein U0104_05710 [Gemmatimonadales bacterium]